MVKHLFKLLKLVICPVFLLCQTLVSAEPVSPTELDKSAVIIPADTLDFPIENQIIEKTQQTKKAQDNTAKNTNLKNEPWLENVHNTVASSVFYSARWFDDFFNDDDSNQINPQTNLRIRLGWIPEEGDWTTLERQFRLRLKLPHFKDKIDFIFSDDDAIDEQNAELENVATKQNDEFDSFTAAIRYVHTQSIGALLDSRIGVASGDIFYRVRYKKRFEVSKNQSIKFEPSAFYFIDDGFASKTLLEYNYSLSFTNQLRATSTFETSESFQGTKWGQGLHKLTQFDEKAASSFGLQVNGIHKGTLGTQVDVYHLAYRYRFNAVRKWLFFEVEPFYQWRAVDNYHPTVGIALRIEGHFVRK